MSIPNAAEQYCFFEEPDELKELNQERETLMGHAKSPNTLKAYSHEWKAFTRWCEKRGRRIVPTDPKTVGLFVTWQNRVGYDVATIRIFLAALRHFHQAAGHPVPVDEEVQTLVSGIAREQARKKDANDRSGKEAVTLPQLQRICRTTDETDPVDVRDRAVILLGFASAWRRSELSALNVDHVTIEEKSAWLRLRYSKGDQEGRGRETEILRGTRPYTCPVAALEAWLKVRGTAPGPLFVRFQPAWSSVPLLTMERLSGQGICVALKRAIARLGADEREYGAHSLRSGMITVADARHVSLKSIMEHTKHKRVETLMKYIKPRHAHPLAGVL